MCRVVMSMRETSMTIKFCVLVVFITSVCEGAAAPVQRIDCVTERSRDCIECICKAETLLQNCSSREPCPELFLERRKRETEDVSVNGTEAQPVAASSTEPVVTTSVEPIVATQSEESTQPAASTSTSAVAEVNASTTSAVGGVDLNKTSAVAGVDVSTTSAAPTSAAPVNPSLPPLPHPSTTPATAVKSRSCKSGSTWEEECNTCWCLDNGMAACTVKRCEVVSPLAGTQTTKSGSPSGTTPLPPTSVQTSALSSSMPVTSERSPTTSVSETSAVQDTTTTVLPSTTSVPSSPSTTIVLSSSSLPVNSTSSSGGTS